MLHSRAEHTAQSRAPDGRALDLLDPPAAASSIPSDPVSDCRRRRRLLVACLPEGEESAHLASPRTFDPPQASPVACHSNL
jgi:hypothetical protein